MAQPRPRASQPRAPDRPVPKARIVFGSVAVAVTEGHLRSAFGRQQDALLKAVRDKRIERLRLRDIELSDRELRAAQRRSAALERAIDEVRFRLSWVKVEKPLERKTGQHRRPPEVERGRPLPSYPHDIIDAAGQRGIFVEITTARNGDERFPVGTLRAHWEYTWDDQAVELLADGTPARQSNMGENDAEIGAAMDLQEEVARATRANAILGVRIIVRLPHDVSPEARLLIMRMIAEETFGQHDLPFVFAIHRPGAEGDKRNHHGHLQGSWRPMKRVGDHEWEVGSELRSDLSVPEGLRLIRRIAASAMTDVSQAVGVDKTYTGGSHRERGLPFLPLKKVGQRATAAWRRGEHVAVVEENIRRIAENVAALEKLKSERAREGTSPALGDTGLGVARAHVPTPHPRAPRSPQALVPSAPSTEKVGAREEALAGRLLPPVTRRIVPAELAASAVPIVTVTPPTASPKLGPVPLSAALPTSRCVRLPSPSSVHERAPVKLAPIPRIFRAPQPDRRSDGVPVPATDRVRAPADRPPVAVPTSRSRPAPNSVDTISRAALDALLFFDVERRKRAERMDAKGRVARLRNQLVFARAPDGTAAPDYARFYQQAAANPTWLKWSLDRHGGRTPDPSGLADKPFAHALLAYRTHPQALKDLTAILDRTAPSELPRHVRAGLDPQAIYDPRTGRRSLPLRLPSADDPTFEKTVQKIIDQGPQLTRQDGLVGVHDSRIEAIAGEHVLGLLHPAVQARLAAQMHLQTCEWEASVAAIESGALRIRRTVSVTTGEAGRVDVPSGQSLPVWAINTMARWAEDPEFVLACTDALTQVGRSKKNAFSGDPAFAAWRRAVEDQEGEHVLAILAVEALHRVRSGTPLPDNPVLRTMIRDAEAVAARTVIKPRTDRGQRGHNGGRFGRRSDGKEKV